MTNKTGYLPLGSPPGDGYQRTIETTRIGPHLAFNDLDPPSRSLPNTMPPTEPRAADRRRPRREVRGWRVAFVFSLVLNIAMILTLAVCALMYFLPG